MSLENVLAKLQKQYDCSNPIYLSNFFKPDGEKWLYNQLLQVYQTSYKNDYRVIIVQDCPDVYEYSDLPGVAVTFLQKYASQIDISNSFILLLTGNLSAAQELEQLRTSYSTDVWPIQHQLVNELPQSSYVNKARDTFCVLPWMHLYIGTDGNILPCCHSNHQYPMGNITEQSIDSIVKSKSFNQLRSNMLNGIPSKECDRCYQHEDLGLTSARLIQNTKWKHIKLNDLNPEGTIDNFEPVYLDIRLNNICNLKCRMCSGYFSSAIAQEEKELFNNTNSINSSLLLQQRKSSLSKILEYLPAAEQIYFAGGEPLLAAEHYEILKTLIECNNTDLEIYYNTNFTTLQYRDISVIDLWKNFSNIKIGASLDAMGAVAEYVRHGTNWTTIESNLNLVKTHCPHVNFTVTSTVGLLNAASLIELQKTWHTTRILDISKFSLTTMISPDHLTVCALPTNHKKRLNDLIRSHITWCQANGAEQLASQWTNVLNYMWSKDNSYHMTDFKKLTNLMDQHRNESLVKTIPEFGDLI